jgi:ADP-ribose pyrophosphatase YjhB (NUDIX family)
VAVDLTVDPPKDLPEHAPDRPRVVAIAIVHHPDTGALFVGETYDPYRRITFHRPCGGGVEYGELATEALVREFQEEYALDVVVGRRLAVIENLFEYAGRQGHEVVFVHEARFADPAAYSIETRQCADAPEERAVWRPPDLSEDEVPLFPEGLAVLLG